MSHTNFRRRASPLDSLLSVLDESLRTLSGAGSPARPSPCTDRARPKAESDRKLSAGLMRVNHAGEICAQALYCGQALVARDERVRRALQSAASEERDHLAWCRSRLGDLEARPSVLDPAWYAGSFALGLASGLAGDRWSLGFLAETEAQVERHLHGHLERLPADDTGSRQVVEKMREDEIRHGNAGRALGGVELPRAVKAAMAATSRLMTRTAFWV